MHASFGKGVRLLNFTFLKIKFTSYRFSPSTEKPSTEKPSTEKPSPTPSDKPKDVVIGKIYPVGKARYKVTSKKAVMLVSYKKPGAKKMNIPSTVRINGRQFKVTAIKRLLTL